MLERNLRAVGYLRTADSPVLLDRVVHRPGYWIELLRERIRTRILAALPGDPAAGILVALAIGDQPAIATQQWSVFTRTGVNHLMSISGLHITMVRDWSSRWWRLAAAAGASARLPAHSAGARRADGRVAYALLSALVFRPSARCSCWRWSRWRC
jgi:competence protein ComEC